MASKTITTTTKEHLGLLTWAEQLAKGNGPLWAIEDCRHLSRRLERDLLAAGQSIVRVPPKLMAHVESARTYGKSDPIDALAVARAAQREPDLPTARLDGPDRDVRRLLGDHRESLVAERTRAINRLRWYLHELDPSWEPKARSLDRLATLDKVSAHLDPLTGTVVRLARAPLDRCRALTNQINELTAEITTLVADMAPSLIAIPGCGAITAAKIRGEAAGVDRFRSKDAYARHNGTAPRPVWSSNRARHRLSRTGNRPLNAALHRIALTQAHWHEPANQMMERRKAGGDSGMEALRVLKRRLSDVVYAALRTDLTAGVETAAA